MKLYAPKYFKKFKCIADKCSHNCCVGWEIDIDKNTLEKYKGLENGYGTVILSSISMEETPHFKLNNCESCPHLNKNGLCEIIINLGEEYLCDICREHPRFYNFTNVAEVGVGLSCPEAARIVLSSPDFADFEEIGEVEAEDDNALFNGCHERQKIYAILQNPNYNYTESLEKIYQEYSIDAGDDSLWLEKLDSLEYLDNEHKKFFSDYSKSHRPENKETDEYLKRFLAYFIYRHCTEAYDSEDFSSRLAFCLFCERLFSSLICSEKAETLQDIIKLASIISEEIEYSEENTLELMY